MEGGLAGISAVSAGHGAVAGGKLQRNRRHVLKINYEPGTGALVCPTIDLSTPTALH
jgi:hypothetical protein